MKGEIEKKIYLKKQKKLELTRLTYDTRYEIKITL